MAKTTAYDRRPQQHLYSAIRKYQRRDGHRGLAAGTFRNVHWNSLLFARSPITSHISHRNQQLQVHAWYFHSLKISFFSSKTNASGQWRRCSLRTKCSHVCWMHRRSQGNATKHKSNNDKGVWAVVPRTHSPVRVWPQCKVSKIRHCSIDFLI